MRIKPRAPRNSKSLLTRLAITVAIVGSVIAGVMPAAHAETSTTYYVRVMDPVAATNGVLAAGGTVTPLDIEGGFLATTSSSAYLSWSAAGFPGVGCHAPASAAQYPTTPYDIAADPHAAANAAQDIGAKTYWDAGFKGQGVDIALIDSGVAPVGDLKNVVIDGPDFSYESQSFDPVSKTSVLAHNDTYGHGTAMASIIHATAPSARILSIKVGISDGSTDPSQVQAAIDWVRQHRNAYGLHIGAINLSYGVVSWNDWTRDPLSKSVDMAWEANLPVVVADGNNGDLQFDDPAAGLESPAFNQNIISVGAIDSGSRTNDFVSGNTTYSRYSDDSLATFSASSSRTNPRLPDVGAPGAHVAVYRVPNAAVDNAVADELCTMASNERYPILGGGKYVRGSGTSEAAAFVSGAVALMRSKNPSLTADQIKRMLKANAHSVPNGAKAVYGDGAVDLTAVYKASLPSWIQNHDTVVGGTTGEASRGGYHVLDTKGGLRSTLTYNCIDPTGVGVFSQVEPEGTYLCAGQDIFGDAWDPASTYTAYLDQPWNDTALGSVWRRDGVAWIAPPAATIAGDNLPGFTSDSVLGRVWPNFTWSKLDWANNAWSVFYPAGVSWDATKGGWTTALMWRSPDGSFSGNRWSGNRWSGNRWSGNRWSGNRWSGNSWREYSYS